VWETYDPKGRMMRTYDLKWKKFYPVRLETLPDSTKIVGMDKH